MTFYTKVRVSTRPDVELCSVAFERREDGWYVRPPGQDTFEIFADSTARPATVQQLIRKEWSVDY